jgi:NADPH-dependent ferric siderophore reductase
MEAKRFDSDPSPLADPSSLAQRLWALEDEFPHELREACLAAGDTLLPALIRQLEASLDADTPGWPLVYAAELLGAIGDSRAVPILLRCLEQSDALEALHHQAVEALVNLGTPALESCLEAYAAAPGGALRDDLACVLERFGRQDERLYEVFLDTLKRTPEIGANCLAAYGDARAIPALGQCFDALPVRHDESPLANRVFIELRCAIEDLGGSLTAEQEAKFAQADAQRRRFAAQMDEALSGASTPFPRGMPAPVAGPVAQRPMVRTQPKLGRNAPCWCGSGKKYKKCHLHVDEGA